MKTQDHNLKQMFQYQRGNDLSNPYSDALYSEECQSKKLLVCYKMFVFFKAIFEFCTAKKVSVSLQRQRKSLSFKLVSFKSMF